MVAIVSVSRPKFAATRPRAEVASASVVSANTAGTVSRESQAIRRGNRRGIARGTPRTRKPLASATASEIRSRIGAPLSA